MALVGPFHGVHLVLDPVSNVVGHLLTWCVEREVALPEADLPVTIDVWCFQHPLQFTYVEICKWCKLEWEHSINLMRHLQYDVAATVALNLPRPPLEFPSPDRGKAPSSCAERLQGMHGCPWRERSNKIRQRVQYHGQIVAIFYG